MPTAAGKLIQGKDNLFKKTLFCKNIIAVRDLCISTMLFVFKKTFNKGPE
jgi:hypothetical protein